ncbi:MAG: tetratricopeptide repeat protein [Gemmatimonadaceae bacterium]
MSASDRIDELKKRYDENPRRFFASLANEYRKAGDLDQAITICQAHLAEQPSNMNGHVVYGQALFEAGRYDEAKTTFEAALNLDPENLIALRHLGDIACTNGENDSARTWYERVLDADPRNEEIIALLAHLAADTERTAHDDPPAANEELVPQEPQAETPPPQVVAAVSDATVSDETPVVPLDAIKTLQTPAVSRPVAAPSESLGLMDLAIDFEVTSEPAHPAEPAAHAEPDSGIEFPAFEEVQLGAPIEAAAEGAATGALLENPFSDPFPESEAFAVAEESDPPEPAQPEPPAKPFVTETMAELYLQQGFNAEALDVYRQLSAALPGDETLKERVRMLEQAAEPASKAEPEAEAEAETEPEAETETEALVEPELAREPVRPVAVLVDTVRSYFAGLAARRAVQGNARTRAASPTPVPRTSAPQFVVAGAAAELEELFAGQPIAASDEQAALAFAQVAGAVEMGLASVKGKPTAPASTELSLDSVFRESDGRGSTPVSRQSQTLRFDQFFAAGGDEGDALPSHSSSAPAGEPGSPAELQQFQSWLTGLKP